MELIEFWKTIKFGKNNIKKILMNNLVNKVTYSYNIIHEFFILDYG